MTESMVPLSEYMAMKSRCERAIQRIGRAEMQVMRIAVEHPHLAQALNVVLDALDEDGPDA